MEKQRVLKRVSIRNRHSKYKSNPRVFDVVLILSLIHILSDLLYVGPQTTKKLRGMNVTTIGDLANFDPILLQSKFGVNGIKLWRFANGTDYASVKPSDYIDPIKSVGHGATSVVDPETNYDVWLALLDLAQDVGHRLKASELAANRSADCRERQ